MGVAALLAFYIIKKKPCRRMHVGVVYCYFKALTYRLTRSNMYSINFFVIFLLNTIELGYSEKNGHEISQLIKSILKGYDKYESPVNETTYLPVKFFLYVTDFNMDYDEQAFSVSGHLNMRWSDKRLTWNQTNVFNKTHLLIKRSDMWTPTPLVVSTVKSTLLKIQDIDISMGEFSYCNWKGSISLYSHFTIYLRNACTSNYKNWPHDSKNCKMSIGFPLALGQNVTISAVHKDYREPNKNMYISFATLSKREWIINSVKGIKKEKNESKTNEEEVEINFYISRNGSLYGTLYFQPSLVNLGLVLGLFWIDPRKLERMVLIGLLLTLQIIFFTSMSVLVPSYTDETPFIMFISAVSFYLLVIQTLVTILSRRMLSTAYNPMWLQFLTTWSIRNPIISQIFFLRVNPKTAAELIDEDEEGSLLIMKTKKLQKQWQIATQILNMAMFLLFVPISAYLMCIYFIYIEKN